ncbi:putative GLUCOSE 1-DEHYDROGENASE [Vibrio nigripulchritudo MADA3029]|uniref:SDR family oxidoreductase n=1 Tax=Vibrio nigripulchritudo TaxID=28173 RepID=UPI0003B1BE9E|nr:SDR family oxidoreductase [Vibrio nigripulchritudo]CCN49303.1 putative GLUCOSE 1-DEHYDROGENASE [Vibrio nigripulchritudo MADA3020]CCN54288.1 putative GLUCOSE 1-DEHYDROGENASE [Vibrio nigripulchritudo MADA3021]CCN61358.1 putative GLUCOSE 1-DEHYDROGENASE [Vibrio nigripulchritudo MADA3029]
MNNVVIVTGGSRGIGKATSLLLASRGYKVCVNFRTRSEEAEETVRLIEERGGTAIACQADVSVESDVIRLFDTAEQALGKLTHLVNNAGALFTQSRLVDMELERFNKVIAANATSCFLCCREAVKRMTDGGAIVNVSSAASRLGAPFEYVDYAASKGAVDSITKGLSLEVAAQNIRVNAVRPGLIYTDIHTDGGEPGRVDRVAPSLPMQRGGTPEEVANTIAWLLSDEASYVTGSFTEIAGGR